MISARVRTRLGVSPNTEEPVLVLTSGAWVIGLPGNGTDMVSNKAGEPPPQPADLIVWTTVEVMVRALVTIAGEGVVDGAPQVTLNPILDNISV